VRPSWTGDSLLQKKGRGRRKNQEGQWNEVVVVDGQGIPLGSHIDSASPAEVTRAEKTLENIRVHDGRTGRSKTRPKQLIADKGYDSDPLRDRLKRRGITPLSP